ncbi:MAG: aspartyl protease [Leptolyngbyaceae cyanobacterium SL_7_1]|nr:aspartyl protease [Leptolyngbyaceae cyanobacterium SL_7_1]
MDFRAKLILLLSSSIVAGLSGGCGGDRLATQFQVSTPSPPALSPSPTGKPSPAPTTVPPTTQPDPYVRAIDRASSAFTIGQAAQSSDDWRLVAGRWQQAIDWLVTVPSSSANYGNAQTKLSEYRRNLAYAQQQADRPTAAPAPSVVAVVPQIALPEPIAAVQSTNARLGQTAAPETFSAPIVRRVGGTPVINVTFNGGQTYEMIVDTGASGTLITQQMAITLGVVPVAQASVDTASARSVFFPLGYVRSVQVDRIVAENVLVAIAGSELDIGLLGQDFFGNYDLSIRQNQVEFQPR